MAAHLNFGPSEQTAAQREAIAQRALAIIHAEEERASAALQALYQRYVAGHVDLYAISVHVRDELRDKLQALVEQAPG